MNFPFKKESLARQVAVKSAVNPSLWACLVISLPLFYLSEKNDNWKSIGYFIIALIPVLAFVISYVYLLFKNPDYLRSEEYHLKIASLKLLGDKDNLLNANAKDIVSVINNPSLPSPEESQKKYE